MPLTEHELLIELQARVLAQQMFTRSVLTAAFLNTPDPLAAVEEMRSAEVLAAQNGVRPMGPYEDEVWTKALEAFHYELNQVAARIEDQRATPRSSGFRDDSRQAASERAEPKRVRVLQEA
jgi:hypothetical protein